MWERLARLDSGAHRTLLLALLWAALPAAHGAESEYAWRGSTNEWSKIEFLKWGPFDAHPSVGGSILYDDNIYIGSSSRKQGDFIWVFSPSLFLGLGDYRGGQGNLLTLRLQPSVIVFTDQSKNNSLDQDLEAFGQWRFTKLVLSLSQGYQVVSGGYVDVGNRITRTIYPTRLSARYEVSPKTSFEVHLQQTINDNEEFNAYDEWVNDNWLNYQLTGKITIGVGVSFGHREIQNSPNQNFERVQARANYQATGKTAFFVSAGGEMTQYQGGGRDGPLAIFNLGVTYQPFNATSIALQAYRTDQNSIAFEGENYTTTGFSLTVRQRFFQKYFVTLSGGYENLDYRSVVSNGAPDHTDNYFFIRPGVDWALTRKWSVGVFYQYREKDAELAGQSFKNNQTGLQTRYTF
jgi:hypothetical protein